MHCELGLELGLGLGMGMGIGSSFNRDADSDHFNLINKKSTSSYKSKDIVYIDIKVAYSLLQFFDEVGSLSRCSMKLEELRSEAF